MILRFLVVSLLLLIHLRPSFETIKFTRAPKMRSKRDGPTKIMPNINFTDVKKDIRSLITDSKEFWPADYGNYGPLFIRLAWHAAGSYRASDGRGGADGGRLRFDPERSWADNTNLDKARFLLTPIKEKYGADLSWADLFILAGDASIESMGGPILGFCGGRIDDVDGSESNLLGPSAEQEALYPCQDKFGNKTENGFCEKPLGPTTVGLIYVNPEGPLANPIPEESAHQIRDTFDRMSMNDSETVALIGGGHAVGKTHGACTKGPGHPPNINPKHPWQGQCGAGKLKGKSVNTVTSGFEFPWTSTPVNWSNQYFKNLLDYEWLLVNKTETPGGHFQWKINGSCPQAPTVDGKGVQDIGMLTSDVALLKDQKYLSLLQKYAKDLDQFNDAFMNAWYKLTTRDMGPHSRCLGDNVPPPQDWQYPLPVYEGEVPNFGIVQKDIRKLMTNDTKGMFVRLAWQCMSTFRSTDYLGGCNGARIRFEPQNRWKVNHGITAILTILKPIKEKYGNPLSWADLIVLAGNTEIEAIGKLKLPFCGGRTDATADDGASNHLAPRITGEPGEGSILFKEFINLLGLSTEDYAALHGLGYVVGQVDDCNGLFCRRDDKSMDELSNMFFRTITSHKWQRNNESEKCFRTKDDPNFCMYAVDVQFNEESELKTIAKRYGSNNDLFLKNVALAWTKLANADRFDGPTGNLCDDTKGETCFLSPLSKL